MTKGNIGVTTENIFPVIKKFLYSDHEIFLREMISNAVDATQKLKTLAEAGEFKGELGDLSVRVTLNKDAGTLTISDRGIGMTAEEIDRYINQIAFSGVTDFLDKYKDTANAIIGHFGLGFYSSFMVSDKVEIVTKSHKEAPAMRWSCDGSPEYELDEADKSDRGTDIVLHIADDCKEFLEASRIEELLNKYCKFMAVPVVFGKKQEWKDGKMVDTDNDNIINGTEPLWAKAPNSLTDDDYKAFYRTLYPMQDEPLFWIHLNVDYPFNLTGILYFPHIKQNIELQRNKIQLYCNQVFVTDQVEGIVPDFLTLLHGVIDSPDIPLNVSRSYLQSDRDVKKISTYITKKVSDRLNSIFKDDRADYESKWDSLKVFINYGMLTQEDFYDRAKDFALLKDTEGKHFTYDEYRQLIAAEQTDKDGNVVYLYANDANAEYAYIEAAKAKGYSVLLMDGQLDTPMVSALEQKLEKARFMRVDSDIVERLIVKDDAKESTLTKEQTDSLTALFTGLLPKIDKVELAVQVQALGEEALPVMITQSEWMRRMKDISRYQAGMAFYAEMPDSYQLVLNSDHRLIKQVMQEMPIVTTDAKAEGENATAESAATENAAAENAAESATKAEAKPVENKIVSQLIDLALLQSGMLRGAALNDFVKRSVALIK